MADAELALEAVLERAKTGLTSPRELTRLYHAAEAASGPGVVVEVGSFRGTSALVLLAGCRAGGRRTDRLYCIDTFQKDTKEAFDRNLGPYIATGEVIPLVGRSLDIVKDWPGDRKIKLLFLDSDHTYQSTKEEILRFAPLLGEGAIVLFHDCFYRPEQNHTVMEIYFWNIGVSQAIRELILDDPRFGQFERVQSLLVARFDPRATEVNDTATERNEFRKQFDAATALNTLGLRAGYATFRTVLVAKRVLDVLGLSRIARSVLRRLGVRTLFKRV